MSKNTTFVAVGLFNSEAMRKCCTGDSHYDVVKNSIL
jgi:hypothetical protein